ncbi:DNA polymerase ligase N-terminal domain-containing protein [Fodinicola feengrottensis]
MPARKLDEYRRKRDPARTPEPIPANDKALPSGNDDTFVIQEHHARRLHWDVRLERGGVLVCWAVPRGLPAEPGSIRLAVHTEDHPLEYATFSGDIPHGEYGGGRMFIWDRGTYETVKWSPTEVSVVLHGEKVDGRYVFFTGGKSRDTKDWMVRRSDPPRRAGWEPLPETHTAMRATRGQLPADPDHWAYEFGWDGLRALGRVTGGRLDLFSETGETIPGFPDVRAKSEWMGSTEGWLDGELVALVGGRPDRAALDRRLEVTDERRARQFAKDLPVTYLVYDLLHLDGKSTLKLPYERRRELLEALPIGKAGWQLAPSFPAAAEPVLTAAREQRMPGVVAKRLDSPYNPGQRTRKWIEVHL